MAPQKAKNTAFKKTKFQFPVSWSKPIVYVPCKSLLCSLEALMFLSGILCVVLYFFKALCFPLRITPVLIVIHVFFYFSPCARPLLQSKQHLASRGIRSS
jgi:hypothetical protein